MKLIEKDVLVAWIRSRLLPTINSNADEFERGEDNERIQTLNFINTIEIKEVDLDKEYKDFINSDNGRSMFETAKHFFELGIKAQKGEEV